MHPVMWTISAWAWVSWTYSKRGHFKGHEPSRLGHRRRGLILGALPFEYPRLGHGSGGCKGGGPLPAGLGWCEHEYTHTYTRAHTHACTQDSLWTYKYCLVSCKFHETPDSKHIIIALPTTFTMMDTHNHIHVFMLFLITYIQRTVNNLNTVAQLPNELTETAITFLLKHLVCIHTTHTVYRQD